MAAEPPTLFFNGIDGGTGRYLVPPRPASSLVHALTSVAERPSGAPPPFDTMRGVKSGVDARDLAQAGWGLVLPATTADSPQVAEQDAILDALRPLLDLRREQATREHEHGFQIYRGSTRGYRPGETKLKFLRRLGVGPGAVDPEQVPYYLLLLASPEQIPYSVQYQLDVQYAVGRLWLPSLEDYARYARSVVAAESEPHPRERELSMFAVSHPDDPATEMSARDLVKPLAERLAAVAPDWTVRRYAAEDATKANLGRLLGGDATPAVLFTASHGVGFDPADPRQRAHQGALLCQDWPGPKSSEGPLSPDLYFSADDVDASADAQGLIVFSFACYSAGTPQHDEYAHLRGQERNHPIADASFVAALPQRMLGLAKGALAVIGHVDRAWGSSFVWPGLARSPQLTTFQSTLAEIMGGTPVGHAMEYFNLRYAELAVALNELLQQPEPDESDQHELVTTWTATHDARGYALMGDPAVRLPWPPSKDRLRGRGPVLGPRTKGA